MLKPLFVPESSGLYHGGKGSFDKKLKIGLAAMTEATFTRLSENIPLDDDDHIYIETVFDTSPAKGYLLFPNEIKEASVTDMCMCCKAHTSCQNQTGMRCSNCKNISIKEIYERAVKEQKEVFGWFPLVDSFKHFPLLKPAGQRNFFSTHP
jgi:hypothetical protein